MSETLSRIDEANDILSEGGSNFNGRHTVDFLSGVYDKLGTLKKRVREARRSARDELLDRAKDADQENDKGQPVLEDEVRSVKAYATASDDINEDVVVDQLIELGREESAKEAVEMALEICGGPNKGATKQAIRDGDLPETALEKNSTTKEDHRERPSRISVKEGKYEDALPTSTD